MKNVNRGFWVVTGLMSAFMVLGAVMDVTKNPEAVKLIAHLGYPEYLMPFLGGLKIAGCATVLIPQAPKWLKEWAYAGLLFDVVGAVYSHLAVGDPASVWMPAAVGIALISGSYALHSKRDRLRAVEGATSGMQSPPRAAVEA